VQAASLRSTTSKANSSARSFSFVPESLIRQAFFSSDSFERWFISVRRDNMKAKWAAR
jgi:hypothetical protein